VDKNNTGLSAVLLLGPFTGGEFKMTDNSLVVSRTGPLCLFDGTKFHESASFKGKRVSIIAFQHSSAVRLTEDDKQLLWNLGFRSRLLLQAVGPSSPIGSGALRPTDDRGVASRGTGEKGDTYNWDHRAQRVLIELCASDTSMLCTTSAYTAGCELVRITEKDDLLSRRGLDKAKTAVDRKYGRHVF
jgi:hypothetical protein